LRNSCRGISQGLLVPALHRRVLWRRLQESVTAYWGGRRSGLERTAGGNMAKAQLVSVVEDDQFFRESMVRLMRSLGYAVGAFSSARDFLSSPRFVETACLIADVHMPAMTGIELYRHLVASGHAIPTILMTGYSNDVDQARALKDGVVCYLRKPFDEKDLMQCLSVALRPGDAPEQSL
jgi:FixJ family two-component response regulator